MVRILGVLVMIKTHKKAFQLPMNLKSITVAKAGLERAASP